MPRHYKRKTTRGQHAPEKCQLAVDAVKEGMSLRQAAATFDIPRGTLEKLVKRDSAKLKPLGRKPIFDGETEQQLVDHAIKAQKLHYGFTPVALRRLAFEVAERRGVSNPFSKENRLAGEDWLSLFMKRHPELSLRQPVPTSINRMLGFRRKEVSLFFQNIEQEVKVFSINGTRIFNVDESGLSTVQKTPKVIAQKGTRTVGQATSAERGTNVTVVCCMSASGTFVPPCFVFPCRT